MKITTVCITFSEKYLLEEMFSLIFYPDFKVEVSSIINKSFIISSYWKSGRLYSYKLGKTLKYCKILWNLSKEYIKKYIFYI